LQAQKAENQAGRAVAAATLGNLVGSVPMVNATFGLFLGPVSASLSGPRSRLSMVLFALCVLSAASFPVVGRLADRWGVRRLAIGGTVLFAANLALLSQIGPGVPGTFALYGLLGVSGAIPSAMLFAKLVSGWTDRRRGLALGFSAGIGTGGGAALVPILAAWLIGTLGWRGAYIGLGLLTLLVGLGSALLLVRDPPLQARAARVQGWPLLAAAMRTGRFWALVLLMGLGAGSLTAVFTHVVPMLTDRGLSRPLATGAVSLMAGAGSLWQFLLGGVLDRTRRPLAMAPVFLLALPGLWLLEGSAQPGLLLFAAALTGLAIGTDYAAIPFLVGRYFPLEAYGAICGAVYGINSLVLGLSPFLMDLLREGTGGYGPGLLAVAACLVGCAALCLLLPRYSGSAASSSGSSSTAAASG